MKVAVILNGISLRRKFFYKQILPALATVSTVEVFETRTMHDAIPLASKATSGGFDMILAAGGDGTLSQTVNGVLKGNETENSLPVLGVIPLGTGNDFARAWGLKPDPKQLIKLLTELKPVSIDVGRIMLKRNEKQAAHYFINIADVGMGPEVVKLISRSDRLFGLSSTYYGAIVKNFFTYNPFEVEIATDEGIVNKRIRTFAMANGKYFGHGLCIAPEANVTDGIFDTFTVGDVSVFDFVRYSGTLKRGKKISHPKVAYGHATHATISSQVPALIEADGELVGSLPVSIDILKRRLSFLL